MKRNRKPEAPWKQRITSFEEVDPREIVANPRNFRTHPGEQRDALQALQAVMERVGVIAPVVVNRKTGNLVDGHLRVRLAIQTGQPTVQVAYVDLTEAEEAEALATFDALGALAGQDDEMLKDLLRGMELDDERLAPVMAELGYSLPKNVLFGVNQDEDEAPALPEVATTQKGDFYILGQHRLLCGDSTRPEDVARLLGSAKPKLMVTDPPYGVSYEAGWRADAKGVAKTEREKSSDLKNDDRADWYEAWALFPGDVAYVWHASAFTDVVMDSLRRAGFEIKQQIIWNKNVHALGRSHYHWKHEPCWYAVRSGGDSSWLAGRDQKTVWDIPNVMFEKDKTAHPTQKAVGVYEIPILNHTQPGEALYEPFGGSGTQIIACEKHGRLSFTMELDPRYCDVIVQRWEGISGQKAVLQRNP